jgi:2-methylisocitrate lyase-like PEP mutase family enzyme
MVQSAFSINSALLRTPCIGDGDTGYGNAVNVKRTVHQYARAGMAGIMIEGIGLSNRIQCRPTRVD